MKRILANGFGGFAFSDYTIYFVAGEPDYIVTNAAGLAWTRRTEEYAIPAGLSDEDLATAKANLASARHVVSSRIGLPATAMGEDARNLATAWGWATEDDFDGDDIIPPCRGWRVKYGFLADDLWNEPPEKCGIDREASVRRYAELCREALEEAYPGAEVKVDWQADTSGSLPATLKPSVTIPGDEEDCLDRCEAERFEVENVENICGAVWEKGSWYVEFRLCAKEFAAVMEWSERRLSVYKGRGLLPTPIVVNEASRTALWSAKQVQEFKANWLAGRIQAVANKAAQVIAEALGHRDANGYGMDRVSAADRGGIGLTVEADEDEVGHVRVTDSGGISESVPSDEAAELAADYLVDGFWPGGKAMSDEVSAAIETVRAVKG